MSFLQEATCKALENSNVRSFELQSISQKIYDKFGIPRDSDERYMIHSDIVKKIKFLNKSIEGMWLMTSSGVFFKNKSNKELFNFYQNYRSHVAGEDLRISQHNDIHDSLRMSSTAYNSNHDLIKIKKLVIDYNYNLHLINGLDNTMINNWASTISNGKFYSKEFLTNLSNSPQTYILNAFCFRAQWKNEFNMLESTRGVFKVNDRG